jgi:hypothetical protein
MAGGNAAEISGDDPLRIRLASSAKVTSNTQCWLFFVISSHAPQVKMLSRHIRGHWVERASPP